MGQTCFCGAGKEAHTAAVGLDVTCIRADNSNGNMSTVSTEEESDGMNNEGGRVENEKGQLVPRLVLVKDEELTC